MQGYNSFHVAPVGRDHWKLQSPDLHTLLPVQRTMQLTSIIGIKTEVQPTNEDLLMTYSGMGLWFDPSTGRFRHQDLPQPFAGHGFPFDFEAAIPSGPSGPEVRPYPP